MPQNEKVLGRIQTQSNTNMLSFLNNRDDTEISLGATSHLKQ